MAKHSASDLARRHSRRPLVILIVVAMVAAIAVSGGVAFTRHNRHTQALNQCSTARTTLTSATERLDNAVKDAKTSTTVQASTLEDPSVLASLQTTVAKAGKLVSAVDSGDGYRCAETLSADELDAKTRKLNSAADDAKKQTTAITSGIRSVRQNVANKTNETVRFTLTAAVSQSQGLLAQTKDQVSDESTRTKLQQLIRTADGQLNGNDIITDGTVYQQSIDQLNAAMDAVTASNIAKLGVDCKKVQCVALTFDDGPDATNTPPVIEALKKTKATATFFSVGEHITGTTTPMLKQLAEAGYPIENHSWNHPHLQTLSKADVVKQLTDTSTAVKKAVGTYPSMIRPPYSEWSNDVRDQAAVMNSSIINFNVMGYDWEKDADGVHDAVLEWAKPGDIILLHDLQGSTAKATERIITDLQAKGYTLVSVPQLLGERPKPGYVYYSQDQVVKPGEPWKPSTNYAEQW
ncbi:polysaccharide deacetylase family protein [Bifidobacterium primatium]|nr:polysaccharide deacetylase family protein [Bifidobacterium primatium]